ncbi:MAG: hypothetical protein IJB49_02250 [Clostridia bacterium]|nr:hypothetical protein [Clostridia bacterium]
MKETKLIRITANELVATVSADGNGVSLYSLRDKKTKKNFLTSSHSLFNITARAIASDDTVTVSSNKGWKNCVFETVGSDTVILLSGNSELCGVTAVLCAHTSGNRIEWTTRLISENDEYSLYECDYPIITFDCNKNTFFLSPTGPGELWNSMEECRATQNYPSYGASMQFMAFWNDATKRGIYYGLHDPSPAYKKIHFEKKGHEKYFTFKGIMPLTDIDRGRNSQALYGSCVWELFDGNWYDAAMLYREFFLKYAVWKPETDENGRKDNPDWMKKVAHWWRVRMQNNEQYVDEILEANADLGYDSPVHLYDWFEIPYDNDYPHYFPARPAFHTGVKRLQENGVKVMPYINARLWDTRDRGLEDWQFTEKALPNCTKNRRGEPFIEMYSSKESDGSSVRLSIMCPSTACWQEKVTEIVSKLLNEVGVNAVYMDQIAAAQPYPCEDRSHSHRPGGGSWWVESYNNLLDHVNRVRPENTALSTECTADPFMKHMQAYLTWIWVHNRQVPAFVAIYSGYVTMFGRNYCYMPFDDDEGQRIMIAQSFTFGEQLGWNDPKLYMQMKHKDFYRKLVHERDKEEVGSYMYNGRLLKTPEFKDSAPILRTERCKEAYGGIVEHSAVFCEQWERADGKRLLVIVNASEEEARVELLSSLEDGVYVLSGDICGELAVENGKGVLSVPPLSVAYASTK